jgi:hypothetical protein
MHMGRCIAYLESGRICGRPAGYVDPQRGGYVCADHRGRAIDRQGPDRAGPTFACERWGAEMRDAQDFVCPACRAAERPIEADGLLVADLGQLKALARLQAAGARERGDTLAAGILMALAAQIEGELRPRRAALEARQEAVDVRSFRTPAYWDDDGNLVDSKGHPF